MTPKAFAEIVVEAQRLRVGSWVPSTMEYQLTFQHSALYACRKYGANPQWAFIVECLMYGAWCDAEQWVEAVLGEAEDERTDTNR